ncbi:MAG: GNAT family N-acetyltransferase [Planctomycetia bacterium]|nr:GNAT family N-acetyltransferase [Planctomycetia bacterium]
MTGSPTLSFRIATVEDCRALAAMNHQLIRDEGHRNSMSEAELEQRMRGWIAGEYRAVLFERNHRVVAYALYREQTDEIYLRQLFVVREHRREGIGRQAIELLRTSVWPKSRRLTVDVLVANQSALAFWRAVGYSDYCLTLEILPQS